MHKFLIAYIQNMPLQTKFKTLSSVHNQINRLATQGANLVVMPETFNIPYSRQYLIDAAENFEEVADKKPTFQFMS